MALRARSRPFPESESEAVIPNTQPVELFHLPAGSPWFLPVMHLPMKRTLHRIPLLAAMMILGIIAPGITLHAQDKNLIPPPQPPSVTGQFVDSRRGFVMRVPAEATLDSLHSGWNLDKLFELRDYVVSESGMVRLIATVKPLPMPPDTINTGAYIYTQADSATARGTAKIRTYYLPTRSVRIEIIPFGLKGHRYTEACDKIFASFRWKPGATSDKLEIE